MRFFRQLMQSNGVDPGKIEWDQSPSHAVSHRELIPETIHSTNQYENNVAEQPREVARVRERGMPRLKSAGQGEPG